MPTALNPDEIFREAADEGKRRLDQSLMALLATGFIAGFTIVFGSVAQALVYALAEPHFQEFARVLGALGFGVGMVFLIVGRAELFSENFFDPIATAFERPMPCMTYRLGRLWLLTFSSNLVGGSILIFVFALPGAIPPGARDFVILLATELEARALLATFARSIVGGALVALLSFLVIAAQTAGARAMAAYLVGFLLALGPFEHVVVTLLHLLFGLASGGSLSLSGVALIGLVALAGNLIGGVGLVTLTHAAQARGGRGHKEN